MVIIRADGNENIGAGHIMRCISIADAIRNIGGDVIFVLAGVSFETMLREKGFDVFVLHTDYSNMESECDSMLSLIKQYHADKCIVDSYYVTDSYFRTLRSATRIVYVDDLMDHAHPVDMLINYNIYAEREKYESLYREAGIRAPEFLLGCEYTPLRCEFLNPVPKEAQSASPGRRSVLISSGGADTEHMELQLMERILRNKDRFEMMDFHFVVGAMNRDWPVLREMSEDSSNIMLHRNVTNMKELMCRCDIAVSATGSTMYELCRCGLPIITYVVADNQIQGAESFMRRGAAVYAGDVRRDPELSEEILRVLEELLADRAALGRMTEFGKNLVDGQGAMRIASKLTASD